MLLFRDEAHLGNWCQRQGRPRGEIVSPAQVWALAKAWYHNRLDPTYSGRSLAEAEAIFRKVGLTSSFWMG